MIEDEALRAAVEQCAKYDAWLKLEKDPAKRQEIAMRLETAKQQMRSEAERVKRARAVQEAGRDQGRDRSISYPRR